MTEGTRAHIADIILELDTQSNEIERIVGEAMQDYSDAVEINETDARAEAAKEIVRYMDAYSMVRKATKILEGTWEMDQKHKK